MQTSKALVASARLKSRPFRDRVGFALTGIRTVARRERSFRSQALLAGVGVVAAAALRVEPPWWAALLLSIGLVLALEAMNGAIEYLLDCLHPDIAEEIGAAKDAAAGAVLIASAAAAAVGVLMVVTHLS